MAGFADLEVQYLRIHGYDRAFVKTGKGPAVLLLHGIGMSHNSWADVIPLLARNHTVIAPDLLGHGASDKPRADYTLGGYANGMRDSLALLGIPRVTVVGHSFGGGVAMQFAYQYPHLVERFVLVDSGGLGRSVNPGLRLLAVPGTGPFVAAISRPSVRRRMIPTLRRLHATRLPLTQDLGGLADVYEEFADPKARAAFRHVLRAVVDWRGQVITMLDRGYLAEYMPALVVWGAKDLVIPVRHAYSAKELIPGARLEIFEDCGHMPHEDDPQRFATVIHNFIASTPASVWDPRVFRDALASGPVVRRRTPSEIDLTEVPEPA